VGLIESVPARPGGSCPRRTPGASSGDRLPESQIELHGATYRFQVYLPEEWRRDDHKQWPIILFLHGRGERGSRGCGQTQIGLPQAVRDHPERWPFVIVMPQCPLPAYWTDPDMLAMAMAALDQEAAEFHADPERTYLSASHSAVRRLGAGPLSPATLGRHRHFLQRRLLELCP